jgi:lipid-binding SYLF domain-containing protein
MRRLAALVMALWLGACALPSAPPADVARTLVADALETLYQFGKNKSLKEYTQFMPKAVAVVILPDVVKGGWIFAAEAGNGVLLKKRPDGSWSDPSFHTLTAASFGLQIGIQDTSVILIVRSEKALDAILKHQGKIGADIGATAVYVGAGMEASTTTNLGADVLAFATPVLGAYIGGSLEGGVLVTRRDMNEAVYGAGATLEAILSGQLKTEIANTLKAALAK